MAVAKMHVKVQSTQEGLDRPCPARGTKRAVFPGWLVVEAVIRSYRPILTKYEGSVRSALPCKAAHFALKISLGM